MIRQDRWPAHWSAAVARQPSGIDCANQSSCAGRRLAWRANNFPSVAWRGRDMDRGLAAAGRRPPATGQWRPGRPEAARRQSITGPMGCGQQCCHLILFWWWPLRPRPARRRKSGLSGYAAGGRAAASRMAAAAAGLHLLLGHDPAASLARSCGELGGGGPARSLSPLGRDPAAPRARAALFLSPIRARQRQGEPARTQTCAFVAPARQARWARRGPNGARPAPPSGPSEPRRQIDPLNPLRAAGGPARWKNQLVQLIRRRALATGGRPRASPARRKGHKSNAHEQRL